MEILYADRRILVCLKPVGVPSTDVEGGVPELLRRELGEETACVRTVHRLDQVVGGVMVLARSRRAAQLLSEQVRGDGFEKEYLAVVHGKPEQEAGTLTDFLYRDKARRMTMVASEPAKGVQEAILDYQVQNTARDMSRVLIQLKTGRTHQIRVQFASRNMPLVGERKYSLLEDPCEIALWSHKIGFTHPATGEWMEFSQEPPRVYPWTEV